MNPIYITIEPTIRVGLITDGYPKICIEGNSHKVANLLIGESFHWKRRLECTVEGEICFLKEPQGNIHIVNSLPIEKYLASVVGSEMNPNAPTEFIKAHAIISRSWALRKIINPISSENPQINAIRESDNVANKYISWEESDAHDNFNVCSDDHCQRYQGIQTGASKLHKCIESTRGEILVDSRGEIADARFSKCCGGRTELFSSCWADLDYDYLQSLDDPWCDLSDMEENQKRIFLSSVLKNYDSSTQDFYSWNVVVSKKDIKLPGGGLVKRIYSARRGGSGRIVRLGIETDNRTIEYGKELAIRKLLSSQCLYSSWFDIEDRGEDLHLHGRGWGHGVGLCQIGAARMAYEGKNYRDILSFYYPGTTITKAYE